MQIRTLAWSDIQQWIQLRAGLWPDQPQDELAAESRDVLSGKVLLIVFVAGENGTLAGFIELSLRSVAEGCLHSPVPYIEGWYVDPAYRRS